MHHGFRLRPTNESHKQLKRPLNWRKSRICLASYCKRFFSFFCIRAFGLLSLFDHIAYYNFCSCFCCCRNTIWPDGKRSNQTVSRDENTKLRTRMATKVALFTLLAGNEHIYEVTNQNTIFTIFLFCSLVTISNVPFFFRLFLPFIHRFR